MLSTLPRAYIAGHHFTNDHAQAVLSTRSALNIATVAINLGYLPVIPHVNDLRQEDRDDVIDRHRHLINMLRPDRDVMIAPENWKDFRETSEEVMLASFRQIKVIFSESLTSINLKEIFDAAKN